MLQVVKLTIALIQCPRQERIKLFYSTYLLEFIWLINIIVLSYWSYAVRSGRLNSYPIVLCGYFKVDVTKARQMIKEVLSRLALFRLKHILLYFIFLLFFRLFSFISYIICSFFKFESRFRFRLYFPTLQFYLSCQREINLFIATHNKTEAPLLSSIIFFVFSLVESRLRFTPRFTCYCKIVV